jgi:hypothetical protein
MFGKSIAGIVLDGMATPAMDAPKSLLMSHDFADG